MIRGGGFPEAEHLSDTGGPGCSVCSMKVNCSSGEMAVTVGNMRNYSTVGTRKMIEGRKQEKKKEQGNCSKGKRKKEEIDSEGGRKR